LSSVAGTPSKTFKTSNGLDCSGFSRDLLSESSAAMVVNRFEHRRRLLLAALYVCARSECASVACGAKVDQL
jgi:hypothetical protein